MGLSDASQFLVKEAGMRTGKYLSIFLAVLVCLMFVGTAAAQESPFRLYSVEPPEGRAGEQMDLILRGDGFLEVKITGVKIEGIEVRDYKVESGQVMGVRIFIPEFAAPGPRGVAILASRGQNEPITAYLEGGFFVHEGAGENPPPAGEPPGEPPSVDVPPERPPGGIPEIPPEDGFPFWTFLLIMSGLAVGGGVAVAIALALRNAGLRQTWQRQAQSQELPKNCQPSTYINRREKLELKPGRWKVTGLKVTLYDSRNNQRGETRAIPAELVSKLDKASRLRLVRGENEELLSMIGDMAREMNALVGAWQSISGKGKDVFVEANLEGGSAEAKFARYHCVGQPAGWKKVFEWAVKLKAVDHLPATFRAPLEGETQEVYLAFLEQGLRAYLTTLVKEAVRLL